MIILLNYSIITPLLILSFKQTKNEVLGIAFLENSRVFIPGSGSNQILLLHLSQGRNLLHPYPCSTVFSQMFEFFTRGVLPIQSAVFIIRRSASFTLLLSHFLENLCSLSNQLFKTGPCLHLLRKVPLSVFR